MLHFDLETRRNLTKKGGDLAVTTIQKMKNKHLNATVLVVGKTFPFDRGCPLAGEAGFASLGPYPLRLGGLQALDQIVCAGGA